MKLYTSSARIKYGTVVNILSSFLCYSLKVQSKSVRVNPFSLKTDSTPFVSSFSNVVVVTGPSAIQYSPTDCTRLAVTMLITPTYVCAICFIALDSDPIAHSMDFSKHLFTQVTNISLELDKPPSEKTP